MRVLIAILALSLSTVQSHASHRQEKRLAELGFSATTENIAKVVAGMTCSEPGGDTLVFREADALKIFEHAGYDTARYRLGYSTLLVERGGEIHTHVITVKPTVNELHYSGKWYQCKHPTM